MNKTSFKILLMFFITLYAIIQTTCKKLEKPMLVATGEITSILYNSAEASGQVIDLGESAIQCGHCYGTSSNVSISGSKTQIDAPPVGGFTSQLSNLEAGTKYYIKAYLSNGTETVYGKEISFTTISASIPNILSSDITSITDTSARSGGNIKDDGGASITGRGVCWSTSTNPTTADYKTEDGPGTGNFTSSITGLSANTTYYLRAYAVNSVGPAYGNELSFTTTSGPLFPPTAATAAATSVTNTTATLNGAVNANGSSTIVTFEYGTTNLYGYIATAMQSPADGANTTAVHVVLTGLTAGTLYHFRIKAVSSVGTTYSDELSFTTQQLPESNTNLATQVSHSTATLNATINATNLSTTVIFEYGTTPAYGTTVTASPNPVIGGNTTGVIANITGLECNNTYYFRVSASNSSGTVFGDQLSFSTTQCLTVPSVTTTSISNITASSVQGGGFVTDDGGAIVTEKGLCWSTNPDPTVPSINSTNAGSEKGSFSSSISGLNRLTLYYLRAYATNSEGTGYGEVISFKTLWDNSTFSDLDGNIYNTVQIGDQIWMAENLMVTRFPNGNPISLVSSAATWDAFTYTGADKAYCYYDNSATNLNTYGALYTWAAAMNGKASSDNNPSNVQGVCPTGWHLPSDSEWKELETALGMSPSVLDDFGNRGTDEGSKLKEAGTAHWSAPNTGANNQSGFTAIPGGQRTSTGAFAGDNNGAYFWSSTLSSTQFVINRNLSWGATTVNRSTSASILYGLSVRCVKD